MSNRFKAAQSRNEDEWFGGTTNGAAFKQKYLQEKKKYDSLSVVVAVEAETTFKLQNPPLAPQCRTAGENAFFLQKKGRFKNVRFWENS